MKQTESFTLNQAGYSDAQTQNGQNSLMKLKLQPSNIFITDLDRPVRDGNTLIKNSRLKAKNRFTLHQHANDRIEDKEKTGGRGS